MKSFRPKYEAGGDDLPPDGPGGRNAEVDFRGEKRGNMTHASTTDPDALLYRKSPGTGAKLCYMGHVLMENRNGLVVDAVTTRVSGHAERLAALEMLDDRVDPDAGRRIRLGADKGYDARDFVAELRERGATPHVAQNQSGRRSAVDERTTRHPGYAISLRIRKTDRGGVRLDEILGTPRQDPLLWPATRPLRLHAHRRGLQPRPIAKLLEKG